MYLKVCALVAFEKRLTARVWVEAEIPGPIHKPSRNLIEREKMKTRVIYLKGDVSDEARLHEAEKQGFKLQSVVVIQGQPIGYLVREPWLDEQKEKVTHLGTFHIDNAQVSNKKKK